MKKLVKLIVILMLVSNIQASDKFDILKKFENAPSWVLTPTISKSKYYVVGSAKDDGYGYTKQYEEAIYNGWVELSRVHGCIVSGTDKIKLIESKKNNLNEKFDSKVYSKTSLIKPFYQVKKSWTSIDNELFVLLSIDKDKLSLPLVKSTINRSKYRVNQTKRYIKEEIQDNKTDIQSSLKYQYSYGIKEYIRNKYQQSLTNEKQADIYNNLPKWIHNPNSISDFASVGVSNIKSFNSFYLVKESALIDARANIIKQLAIYDKIFNNANINILNSYVMKQHLSKDGNFYVLIGIDKDSIKLMKNSIEVRKEIKEAMDKLLIK